MTETQTNEVAPAADVKDNPGTLYPFASVSFSDTDLASALQKVDDLEGGLPSMPGLTSTERIRLAKLGTKSRGFADLALESVKADPTLLPGSITKESFIAQDQLLRDLSLVQTRVSSLKAKLDDALMLIGSQVFSNARTVYAIMKTDTAKAKLQEQKMLMKQRWISPKKKKDQPESSALVTS